MRQGEVPGLMLIETDRGEAMADQVQGDGGAEKIGVLTPTYNRPDYIRAALLQMAAQTRLPDIVCVHQNGHPDSYEWCISDLTLPYRLIWLHTPEKIRQHDWYIRPLRRLLEEGCTHFFWADHDDTYLERHIEVSVADLREADFRISRYADVIYLDGKKMKWHRNVDFQKLHGPGGMSASMAFKRPFAERLLQELEQDTETYFSDNVLSQKVQPHFRLFASSEITTRYMCHPGTVSSGNWLRNALGESGS